MGQGTERVAEPARRSARSRRAVGKIERARAGGEPREQVRLEIGDQSRKEKTAGAVRGKNFAEEFSVAKMARGIAVRRKIGQSCAGGACRVVAFSHAGVFPFAADRGFGGGAVR